MKPFDLEQARKQNGEGLITRDGRLARIVCWDRKSHVGENCLIALIKNGVGETPYIYNEKGFYMGVEDALDLFMAPTKHEGWVNVYKDGGVVYIGTNIYKTEEEATRCDSPIRVACVHIEWEE